MVMKDEAVKDTVAEIDRQAMYTKQALGDIRVDLESRETITETINERIQSTMDQN